MHFSYIPTYIKKYQANIVYAHVSLYAPKLWCDHYYNNYNTGFTMGDNRGLKFIGSLS